MAEGKGKTEGGFSLYSWQKECMRAWFDNQCRGIVNVVTGAGKTTFALAAMIRLEQSLKIPLRVKIVVPGRPLMSQWSSALRAFPQRRPIEREEIGYYAGGRRTGPDRKYMIYIINSARYSLAGHILSDLGKGYAVLLIADECHRYASGENRKIFEFAPYVNRCKGEYYSIGLSATPGVCGYDTILVPALGREIYRYTFEKAAKRRTICPFSIYQIALSFTGRELDEYEEISGRILYIRNQLNTLCPYLKRMDQASFFSALRMLAGDSRKKAGELAGLFLKLSYRRKGMVCAASARIACVCDLVERLDDRERILIFGERIEQAEEVYRRLNERYPNQTGCYHSEMGQQANRNALDRFRDGSLRILITCRALDEGVDVPDVSVGIVLSGTSVERQRIQRLGRILRRKEGKRSACLYYLFVKESSEERAFFPKRGERFKTCDLLYREENHLFCHPAYEEAAFAVINDLERQRVDEDLMEEAGKCLAAGLVRPDWLLSEEECEEWIKRAENTREKNYWICMKRMAKYGSSRKEKTGQK